jgi:hypothetical protein
MITVLSDQQISNFIRQNLKRGDNFHEVLGDDCRVWKSNTGGRTAVVKAVISTGSDHAQLTSLKFARLATSNTAIIQRRKKQLSKRPAR